MNELESKSVVARFRRQQALEEEAARLALYGYAEVARGGERILSLIAEGKHEQAQALMNKENWGVEESEAAAKEEPEA
ncbi:MAG TPA: hypothetical protein VKP04_03330 [Ktedonobacteraceae bacterium]|nr:hypothetical protein [Ktedonobacteraceae bacterium]